MFETRPDRGAEVVLVGRSNVGKSTLMRRLTGHDVSTGKRPGVTREPNHYDWASEDFVLTDLPGFGFMSGVPEQRREQIKTDVIRYLEANADATLAGVLVLDGKAAVDIIDRHSGDDVPYDVEMYYLLEDLGIPPVVAVNKMDKVDDRDERLDAVVDRLGLLPPWQQWRGETVAPISAKQGRISALEEAVRHHLHEAGRDDLFKFF
ncbi:MAG: GTP-binding protein EngB [Halobacteriaceae archaeon]